MQPGNQNGMTRRRLCREAVKAMGAGAVLSLARETQAEPVEAGVPAGDVTSWMTRAGGPAGWRVGVGLNGFMSSSSTYNKIYPIWEVLDFCRQHGFDGIELVNGWPMGAYPDAADRERIDSLKGLYERYGLKIYTIQPKVPGRPFAPTSEERKQWLDGFRQQVALAKRLGCDFIGHWPGGKLKDQSVDEAIDQCVTSYREAARVCADAGMWLSFEIEPPFVFNTLDHLKRLLAGVDHPACKTNFDPSHFDLMSGAKGKPGTMLRELGVKHIGHVHLTDSDGTIFDGTSKHLACGDGHCDIHDSLRTLWDGGYRGWIMIDAWKIEDPYDACVKGKQAVDRVLSQTSQSVRER